MGREARLRQRTSSIHRYLWNPIAIDRLLAHEKVTSLSSAGNVLWPLGDHLGTIRDLASHDSTTDTTTIDNHRVYDSFGNLMSETNSAVDEIFGFTGRMFDESTGFQNNLNRWYDPKAGRWITEDPLGFAAGNTNLYRYVGNSPTNSIDPTGLADPSMAWNWHHLLDQAIFTPEFLRRHGLNISIDSAEYGWMLRAKDHTGTGGIHAEGWSKRWTDWIAGHERAGTRITKDMIDGELRTMMKDFNLCGRGFRAKFSYGEASKAYKVAERMARQRASGAASDIAGKLGRKAGSAGRLARRGGGFIVGIVIAVGAGWALGSDDPLGDAIESIDPLDPGMMGDGEITPDLLEYSLWYAWQRHQEELNALSSGR